MTTGSGKKTSKTGKASISRGRRKKVVDKAPVPAEIDKQKMAAFFSVAGLDEPTPDVVKEPVETEAKETEKIIVSKESGEPLVAESAASLVNESGSADESEPVTVELENNEAIVVAEPVGVAASDSVIRDAGNNEKNGKTAMTTTSPVTDGGSDSIGILSMVFVLAVLALFWFYYISSAPLKSAAVVQVEQGKAEISALMSKIKGLEAEVAGLKTELVVFEKAALAGGKAVVKVVPKGGQTSAVVIKKDSSFDKAPVPFWRQMKRGPLAQQTLKKVKPEVKAPALKVDSFSKAPKPFWLNKRVKPEAVKVEKEIKISAPPAAKAVPQAKKITAQQEPASNSALDPSFEKAPKPFWLKN
ncbi:MAG: hypothetical protein J7L57_05005 [Deltaproteobacteria bacterium]|nr:hypothetical protein [Candidatus Tharpella sp.]